MNDIYTIRTIKRLGGGGGAKSWSNTYHIEITDEMNAGDAGGVGIESDAFAKMAQAFLTGETNMHTPNVLIERAVCSTLSEGDKGLPLSVRVIPWGRIGLHAGNPDDKMLPLEIVLKIAFSPKSGRSGSNQYRGCLWSGDVEIVDGQYHLKAGKDATLGDALVGPLDALKLRPIMRIAHVKDGVGEGVPVSIIAVAGLGFRQRSQKKKSVSLKTSKSKFTAFSEATQTIRNLLPWVEVLLSPLPELDNLVETVDSFLKIEAVVDKASKALPPIVGAPGN